MITGKVAAIVASLTVIVAVFVGLILAGSPGEERLRLLDELRTSDLIQLSGAITAYWEDSDRLPAELAILVDGLRLRSLPTDPETEALYSYEIMDASSYKLCAVFAGDSDELLAQDFWSHTSGLVCFNLRVEPKG